MPQAWNAVVMAQPHGPNTTRQEHYWKPALNLHHTDGTITSMWSQAAQLTIPAATTGSEKHQRANLPVRCCWLSWAGTGKSEIAVYPCMGSLWFIQKMSEAYKTYSVVRALRLLNTSSGSLMIWLFEKSLLRHKQCEIWRGSLIPKLVLHIHTFCNGYNAKLTHLGNIYDLSCSLTIFQIITYNWTGQDLLSSKYGPQTR